MSTPALVLASLFLGALVIGDLLWSPGYMRRVRAAVARGDAGARLRMYRLSVALAWAAAGAALALLLAGGLTPAEIGLTVPSSAALAPYGSLLVGMVGGLVGGAVLALVRRRRGRPAPVVGEFDVLLPRTAEERREYALVAVTAGITEEVVYRAMALTVLLALVPGDAAAPAVLAAAVLLLHALLDLRALLVAPAPAAPATAEPAAP